LILSETASRALSHCELPAQFFVPTQILIGKPLAAKAAGADVLSGGKKPQARPGDEMRAWGSGRRCQSIAAFSVPPRSSGRAAVDSVGSGFGRPNAALAATKDPQVSKAAASRHGARKVHRSPAIRGHSGRTMPWSPTGRFSSCNANMVLVAVHFKRTNEIQTHV